MFFKPELNGYALHNESDDDGDGDGVNETHVRRYINKAGRHRIQHDDERQAVGLESRYQGR